MLKRLSASFAANNGPSLNGEHGPAGPAYGSQPASLSIPEGGGNGNTSSGSGYGSNYNYGLHSPGPGHGYPRPPGQSTPYSESSQSSSGGYFPAQSAAGQQTYQQPQSGYRIPSPLRSPALAPSQAQPSQYRPTVTGTSAATKPIAPLPPIDRLTLQKSLKGLETLLVAMDEYRELNTRLGKVEKRLAKNAKELAASMVGTESGNSEKKTSKGGSGGNDAAASQSIISALVSTSTLFDILSDTNSKFSKSCQKEYDSLNEFSSKYFKKIAKEESKHDEVLESLDNKLKKANFAYDKQRVARSAGNNSSASLGVSNAAHEQFVPVLSQLTEDITKARFNHGSSMANRRDLMIREVARGMTNICDLEFRRCCEGVKRTGAEIGNVLAGQALLGEKADKGEGGVMPSDWPPELVEEYNAVPQMQYPQQQQMQYPQQQQMQYPQQQQMQYPQQGNIHPTHWASQQQQQQDQQPPQPTYQDLRPPRPVIEQYGSVRSNRSDTSSRRSSGAFTSQSSQNPMNQQSQQVPRSRPPSAAPSPRLPERDLMPASSSYSNNSLTDTGSRRVSFSQAPDRDIEATVTARPHPTKPSLDTSFSPYLQQQQREPSPPPLKQSPLARQPAVQTPSLLQHAVSQRGNVGYFDTERGNARQTAGDMDSAGGGRAGMDDNGHDSSTLRRVTMPTGFVIDETEMSPENPMKRMPDTQDRSNTWRNEVPSQRAQVLDYGASSQDDSPVSSTLSAARSADSDARDSRGSQEVDRSRREGGADLERSASVESTASQQSFVARMKMKYVQDKEARQDSTIRASMSPPEKRPLPAPSHSASSSSSSGSARVSSIAQKYEQASSSSSAPSPQVPHSRNASLAFGQPHPGGTVRPSHSHRQSLPLVPGYSSRNDNGTPSKSSNSSMRFSDSPRLASSQDPRNRSSEALIQEEEEDTPHPAMCACEDCSLKGYDTTSRSSGRQPPSSSGGRIVSEPWNDATVRSNKSNRRISMPLPVSMAPGRL